jgi:2-hydroxy-3-keto-5-methylthiopentenyl-1-phosphate phosphatase
MNPVIFSDFDGTITTVDTAELVLVNFAEGDWWIHNNQLKQGEITLEECMERQYGSIKASEEEILSELEMYVQLRPYFIELVNLCHHGDIPFIVVSAGLDFVIRHFLNLHGVMDKVQVCAAETFFNGKRFRLTLPRMKYKKSMDFKDDLVRYQKELGRKVIYIGDGLSDYQAVKIADQVFAIENSSLSKRCDNEGIEHTKVKDFKPLLNEVAP